MTTHTDNGAVLTAHEATIQTAQVEIRVMKVGKKQVTMGMFRQLPRAPLIDKDTLALRGVPWGHVNYWWEGDGRDSWQGQGSSRHVVWQHGETLCRDIVYEEVSRWQDETWLIQETRLMTEIFLRRLPATSEVQCFASLDDGLNDVWIDGLNLRVSLSFKDESLLVVRRYCARRDMRTQANGAALSDWEVRMREDALAAYTAMLDKRELSQESVRNLEERLRGFQAGVRNRRARWHAHFTALAALPQLFIAV